MREEPLEAARRLAALGKDEAAKQAYVAILRREPTHFAALNELAALAYASGHRSAARTAYEQAVRHHPENPVGRVNLGNLLAEEGDHPAARRHYEAALAAAPDLPEAHQGLARVLAECGEPAEEHWQRGFAGHAIVAKRYRGKAPGIPLLLLVAARGGNVPTQHWIDDRRYRVTAVYADFYDGPLPPHALVVNAIGDADLCGEALLRAEALLAGTTAPIVNPPAKVRPTGRAENARRLGGLPGVVAPRIGTIPRSDLARLTFPLLLRAPGFHTGRHFIRADGPVAAAAAVAAFPGETLLAIECLDARGADGMARKYRVMIIDGGLYPLHLAISSDWKVHYFTAAMAGNAAYREEESRFLEDMPGILGAKAMAALAAIGAALDLDYAGVDFAVAPDGSLLLFEANAAMTINPPDADAMWDYRRPAAEQALTAAREMLRRRS
jgi:hypothetical protein